MRQSLSRHVWHAAQDWWADVSPFPSWPLVWRRDAERLELDSFQRGREYERDHQHA